jgi:hypothetical protein
MISWAEDLYLSKNMKKRDLNKIKKAVETNKIVTGVYCITFASNPKNLFEIYNANEFLFPHYKKEEKHVLGLAESRPQSFQLVMEMIEEIYKNTGDFKVRDYF